MKLKLFYSWQSDTDKKSNHDLVRDALETAFKGLDYEIELDEATRGVPGSPSIVDSILHKIGKCALFVPDITLVGRYSEKKYTVNPNVLIEYGYALWNPGEERIIAFMNRHYGDPEDLPFDLRFRAIRIQYTLAPDADSDARQSAKKQLAGQFIREISLALNRALFEDLTPNSVAAIELFVTDSDVGASGRPELDFTELCSRLGLDEAVGRDVVDELEGRGFLRRISVSGNTLRSIRPTDSLFWHFDRVFKGWNTQADAYTIAERLVNGTKNQFVSIKLAEELGWEPRRLNPALTFLVQNGIVNHSEMSAHPFAVYSILETSNTRRYVRQQASV
jgi:hypothetical protein